MKTQLKSIVKVVGDLPSLPNVADQVMKVAGDANASADDLRKILDQDPALAARVLKVANSSLYSFRREVETLRHAITLLGFRTVENLVMAASLRDVFSDFGLAEKLLWEHATATGAIAARLSKLAPLEIERDAAFTAGLLHDIGKIALINTARERYNDVMTRTYNEAISFTQAEVEEFGVDHAEVGAHVADKWRLHPRLVNAIRYHHHDPKDYASLPDEERRLIALTTIATRACTRLGIGRRAPVDGIRLADSPAWALLGFAEDDEGDVLMQLSEEAKRSEGAFQ